MSAVPIFIPPVSIPRLAIPPVSIPPVSSPPVHDKLGPAPGSALPATAPVRWRLTDRGIAIVLFLIAAILAASVITIGVTALRVTSADYDARLHESMQAQR
jgi:hypothetical protein